MDVLLGFEDQSIRLRAADDGDQLGHAAGRLRPTSQRRRSSGSDTVADRPMVCSVGASSAAAPARATADPRAWR